MNNKYFYKWSENETRGNYETAEVITAGFYTFEDFIRESVFEEYGVNYSVMHEPGSDTYYIIDGANEPTGEVYILLSQNGTEEAITW